MLLDWFAVLRWLLYGLLSVSVWVLYQFYESQRIPSGYPKFKGPKPALLVGNLSDFLKYETTMPELLLQWSRKYGKIVRFWGLLNRQHILINDPAAIKTLLQTNFVAGHYAKGENFQNSFRPLFGRGIFGVNGEEWKRHRKFASALFQRQQLRAHLAVFEKHARRLVETLEALPSREEVDMQDYFMRYTLDTFGEIGFGCQMNSIAQAAGENRFAVAFQAVQTRLQARDKYVSLRHVLPKDEELERELAWLNRFTYAIIRQRQAEGTEELRARPDLLSRAIVASRCGDESAPATSDEELRDFVVNFMMAGRDTTAVLLSWASHLLASHPGEQEKTVAELARVGWGAAADWERTRELRFTKQVLQESLRLFPPVPVDFFEATRATTLLPGGGGHYVRKGTPVLYSAYTLHRQPELWPEPEVFQPSRFDTSPAPYTFLPFHGGPRVCLGQDMAYLEAKVMLSALLQRFHLVPSALPGSAPVPKFALLCTSGNGVRLRLEDRAAVA